jgi:hypothetical protein
LLGTAPLLLLLMLQRHGPLLLRSLLLLIMLLLDECDVNDQIWSSSSLELWCVLTAVWHNGHADVSYIFYFLPHLRDMSE